jgi:hypothetical protein
MAQFVIFALPGFVEEGQKVKPWRNGEVRDWARMWD